ncbi:MAG: metalloregulator ArsR/SmtB family transcription factor [Terrimesophilobacter sp.]
MTTDLPIAALKAEFFKALAHPLRIRALETLTDSAHAGKSVSVGELAELLGVEITQVSQQLAVLRRANIVTTRREGNTIYYSVRDPRMTELLSVARQLLLAHLQDSQSLLASLEEEGSTEAAAIASTP